MTPDEDWLDTAGGWDLGGGAQPPPAAPRRVTQTSALVACCPTCAAIDVRIRTSEGERHVLECGACATTWKEIGAITFKRALVVRR